MLVSKPTLTVLQIMAGFAAGLLISHIFLRSLLISEVTEKKFDSIAYDIRGQDVLEDISQVLIRSPKPVPTLQEDWGEVKCPSTELSDDEQNLFDYISEVTLPCSKKVMIGGKFTKHYFDGEKWCCIDKSFRLKPTNCTAFSFGISSDWTFDDEMDKTYGCKVYSFDPTIGKGDHRRSENIRFFNMGISDGPGTLKGGKLESYKNILEMLNLTNSIIDYLKMDVEGSEFKFLRDVLTNTPNLLKNVKQVGMELHLKNHEKDAWELLQRLDCLGFKVMFVNFNPIDPIRLVNGKMRVSMYEIVWGQDRKW